MEKLYRAQIPLRGINEPYSNAVDNPIEHDNKAFDIVDGNNKMLDYLDYSGTITKGTLAANGIIKLCPNSFDKYKKDFGAIATPKIQKPIEYVQEYTDEEDEDTFENEWDNVFLKPKVDYDAS